MGNEEVGLGPCSPFPSWVGQRVCSPAHLAHIARKWLLLPVRSLVVKEPGSEMLSNILRVTQPGGDRPGA